MPGYDPNFLQEDISLPLPSFSPVLAGDVLVNSRLTDGFLADYVNYSIITHQQLRSPILCAFNIDQNLIKRVDRSNNWRIDSRIGAEFQLDNDYYRGRDNDWDRGHLARRASAAWGQTKREAKRASDETFYYSNATLQHENFNQDEWLALENWVFDLKLDSNGKITILTGPIYGDSPRSITPSGRETALIPSAFFKVVCFINKDTSELDVRAFIMAQDAEALRDKRGGRMINFQRYQVTITEIEDLTGLEFDDAIYEKNPLLFNDNAEARRRLNINRFPEVIEVDDATDIVDANRPRDIIADDEVDVFIVAAMVNPVGNEREGEWVSLINLSGDVIDLDGWTLSDTKREPLILNNVLDDLSLSPGESVKIQPLNPLMLSNQGGTIVLYDKGVDGQLKGRRIHRVHYTTQQARAQGVPIRFLSVS